MVLAEKDLARACPWMLLKSNLSLSISKRTGHSTWAQEVVEPAQGARVEVVVPVEAVVQVVVEVQVEVEVPVVVAELVGVETDTKGYVELSRNFPANPD